MLEFRTDTGSFLVGGERAVAETEALGGEDFARCDLNEESIGGDTQA